MASLVDASIAARALAGYEAYHLCEDIFDAIMVMSSSSLGITGIHNWGGARQIVIANIK